MNPVCLSDGFIERTRCGVIAAIIFLITVVGSCSYIGKEGPEERAKEFLSNVYTGKQMKAEEWLSREARAAPLFNAFGGLERMIQQSAARAERYGGLRSVEITEIRPDDQRVSVKAQIRFARDHKAPDAKAVAANEDIIWDLRLVQEDGAWKIAP
jgi:hypothetical protein